MSAEKDIINEIEAIVKLEELGYEDSDTPCRECGSALMFKERDIETVLGEFTELITICPHCGNREVTYED